MWYVKGLLYIPKSLYLFIVFALVLSASYEQLFVILVELAATLVFR